MHSLKKGVVIVGMHRSGTSLTVEMVHRWGAFLGPLDELVPPGPSNPYGHWEFAPLVEFNQRLLRSVDSSGWRPPADEAAKILQDRAWQPTFRDEALSLLARVGNSPAPWAWKDPRLSVLLPFWREVWREVVYVIPFRRPEYVAHSLARRDRSALSAGLLLWLRYTSQLLLHLPADSDRLFIDYDALLTNPSREAQRLCVFLENRLERSGENIELVAGAVKPPVAIPHSSLTWNSNSIWSKADRLFQGIQKLSHSIDNTELSPDVEMPTSWREYLLHPHLEIHDQIFLRPDS